ncbi:amino acid/amide ABC transporter membrane protein 1, HAAT family [Enhydrobacter aerosaccus]|uniref:Amino acid/amide ABC transporter membrane protein 1, HAAT family n=1 Tax=Enhydrobacter aerosaccus TaxID=225324 RepID=A0A1T4JK84_9HYPH|nr:branched-chain amino acid ABC transporter permease [Enhydrobacter aerosaccus]SJZ30564.1 amino acid/amide ABC transporter membrane protein 1, HAAT family [Enhydrobacter aerosaccus]
MILLTYLLLSGLTTGSLYALIALGIVVVNKSTGVINFAHGELFMFSGLLAWTLHVQLGVSYLPSLAIAVVLGFALGVATNLIAFRPIKNADVVSLVLATIGLAFVVRGAARVIWGGKGDYLSFPPITSPDPISFGEIMVIPQQIAVLAGAIVIMLVFAAFFRLTRAGKMMQAAADNAKASKLVGIRVDRIYMLSFGTGAAIAAAAAVLMAPLTLLYPDMGFSFFIKGFAAAVLGGLTSLPGAVLGGFCIGVIEALAGGYINSSFMEVSAFIVIMFVLVVRPTGLLGLKGMRRI